MKTIFTSKWYVQPGLTVDRTHAEYDQDIILVIFHLFGQLFGRTFQERELCWDREKWNRILSHTHSLKMWMVSNLDC